MSIYFKYSIVLFLLLSYAPDTLTQPLTEKGRPRIVITADPELDDNNSLIRFLLYSSDVDIEGLIYASSQFHWKGDGQGTKWFVPGREYTRFGLDLCPCESWRWAEDERFIHDAVEAYEKVYPNLKIHHPNYPEPDLLKSKIRYGNIEFDGDISKDSPGSELIKSLILDDEPGNLFITAWGGASTIARALKSIKDQYEFTIDWPGIQRKVSAKVILLLSGDQDDTYARYIKPHWSGIESRQFSLGPNYGYGAQIRATPENARYLTPEWMKDNVTSKGALGELYRVWGDGKQMVEDDRMDFFGFSGKTAEQLRDQGYVVWMPPQEKGSWLGEGDNHTFMNMLGNGLRAYEDGSYGGWGGRSVQGSRVIDFGTVPEDTSARAMAERISAMGNNASEEAYPNFFPAAQNDFAARLDWSVTRKFSRANHAPMVTIQGPLQVLASPGQKMRLNGSVADPDDDDVEARWWQFQVGSYPGKVEILKPNSWQTEVVIPQDARAGQTIHLVFEATDNGKPALTRYQRVIVTVRGE